MRVFLLTALAFIFATLAVTTAEAKRYTQDDNGAKPFWEDSSSSAAPTKRERRRGHSRRHRSHDDNDFFGSSSGSGSVASSEGHHGVGPRPGAWCGWYMRTRHGGGPEYNRAASWAHWGSSSGPQVGAIVVWPHHVGEITGRAADGRWIVLSGNDSHRVRERARSVAGAVFRVG